MLPSDYQDLIRHMEWADALVWKSLLALPEADSDTRMKERLYHAHSVQWAYLQIWRGESIDIPEASSFDDLRDLQAWAHQYYQRLAEYLHSINAEALRGDVQFPWAQQLIERWGSARPATLAETIFQVTCHTTYHRGQINTRLRELGGEPPLTDYVAWIWSGRPTPAWGETKV